MINQDRLFPLSTAAERETEVDKRMRQRWYPLSLRSNDQQFYRDALEKSPSPLHRSDSRSHTALENVF